MSKKSLTTGIIIFLLLFLVGNAGSGDEPIYAGWTVGEAWDGYGTILRSTDSGKTWFRQGAGQIADVNLMGVFAPDPYTAWVVGFPDSGYATIYRTTDGGITWERKGSSNPASANYVPNVTLYKVHAAGNNVWAVGDDGAILHTSNGGSTWTNYKQNNYNNQLQGVYTLGGNTVWATSGTRNTGVPDPYGIIFKTTDAGLTWTRYDVHVDDLSFILAISTADADTAWAVGGLGYVLLKTTDGGTSWTRQSNGVGGLGDLNEVYAVSSSTIWVAADTVIYWSTDGGENWENSGDHGLASDIAFMGISAVSAQEAWASHAATYGGISHTSDGGSTWTTVDQLNGVALPGLWTISFATQPINPIPALSGWGTLVLCLMIAASFLWMTCRKKRTGRM